jgi:hypothetical protein
LVGGRRWGGIWLSIGRGDDVTVAWNWGWRKRDPINTIVLGRMAILIDAVRSGAFDCSSWGENRAIRYSLVKGSRLESDLFLQPWAFVIRKSLEKTFPDPIQDTLLAFYSPDGGDSVLLPVTRDGIVAIDEANRI